MGQINRVPRGLLGLLDAKTQGRTPPDTTGVLSPVIDLTPNYLADIPFQAAQLGSLTSTVGLTVSQVEVPAGELWYVYVVSAEIICTATNQQIVGVPVYIPPTTTISVPLRDSQPPFSAAFVASAKILDSYTSAFVTAEPLLVGPGTVFGTRLTIDPGAANVNCLTSVVYRPVVV